MKLKLALAAAFVATVYLANWLLDSFGVIPVGFGLEAPAGVLAAGLAFGLRDALHEAAGHLWVVLSIVAGALLSYVLTDAAAIPGGVVTIAAASGVAFLFSELADMAVYTPLRERRWTWAVVLSNSVGAVVDSALFLWLAFGSVTLIWGQLVGKAYMIAIALPLVWMVRRARS